MGTELYPEMLIFNKLTAKDYFIYISCSESFKAYFLFTLIHICKMVEEESANLHGFNNQVILDRKYLVNIGQFWKVMWSNSHKMSNFK